MFSYLTSGFMLIVAVIHLLPLSGALGIGRLENLYGIEIAGRDLEILMRHRAVLFGLLGGLFAYAAFDQRYLPLAFVIAFISIASFFYLAFTVGEYNSAIQRVVVADVVATVALLLSIIFYFLRG